MAKAKLESVFCCCYELLSFHYSYTSEGIKWNCACLLRFWYVEHVGRESMDASSFYNDEISSLLSDKTNGFS